MPVLCIKGRKHRHFVLLSSAVSLRGSSRQVHGCLNHTACLGGCHSSPHPPRRFKDFVSRHTVFVKWLTVTHSHFKRHFSSTFTKPLGDKCTISIGLWKTLWPAWLSFWACWALETLGLGSLRDDVKNVACGWMPAWLLNGTYTHHAHCQTSVCVSVVCLWKARLLFSGRSWVGPPQCFQFGSLSDASGEFFKT